MEKFIENFIVSEPTVKYFASYINLIKRINGIKVKCYLRRAEDDYYFRIEFAGINNEASDVVLGTKKINVKSRLAKDMAEELLKYIKNIKFNKFEGRFEENNFEQIELIKELQEIENVELHGGECCVCYEHTIIKTSCRHNLCYVCWSGIKVKRDDNGCTEILCPMCRNDIYNNDSDYDSDYEI